MGVNSQSQSRMGESLRSIVGGDEKTAQTKTMSKKQNKPSTRNMNNKFEEGCKCPECHQGIMQYPQVENCSCHINPPCSACTSNLLTCSKCGCEEPAPFYWLVVEMKQPFARAIYRASDALIESGLAKMDRAIELYKECQASGKWDLPEVELEEIDLP